MKTLRVGILGAKGYAAGEAIRLLAGHPRAEIACLMARVDSPEPIARYFPALRGLVPDIEPMDLASLAGRCDAVVLGLPHTTSQEYAPALVEAGACVVDLSADFRFDSVAAFERTYKVAHKAPALNGRFPYALPELFGDEIAGAPGLACPGCYPTATLLGLGPLARRPDRFDLDRVVVNALSGVSGAGRKSEERYSFVECAETVSAYSVGGHRHRPEIEEKLERLSGGSHRIVFTTHLLPIRRGMLATTTVPLKPGEETSGAELQSIFEEAYRGRPFVRVLPPGEQPAIAAVQGTNFCDLAVVYDAHARTAIVVTAIDNLTKGAAGQAIQAMNLRFGLEETAGLIPSGGRG